MRHHTALQRIIRQITLASLAGAPMAVACGGTTGTDGAGPTGGDGGASVEGGGDGAVKTDAGINPQGFDKTVCNGPNYESVSGLTPAAPLDYVELRQAWVNVGSDAGSPPHDGRKRRRGLRIRDEQGEVHRRSGRPPLHRGMGEAIGRRLAAGGALSRVHPRR